MSQLFRIISEEHKQYWLGQKIMKTNEIMQALLNIYSIRISEASPTNELNKKQWLHPD